MRGQCLCGQVGFEILGRLPKLYQCHCSLCRKQGGSSSNSATIVAAEAFRWLRGTDGIGSWIKDSGFRSDFCSHCGSPVPNPLGNARYFWVPAGLLDDDSQLEVAVHLHVASRAAWDPLAAPTVSHQTMPGLAELIGLINAAGSATQVAADAPAAT